MSNYVELHFHRNRGWPWHEDSWGLTPMYGEDGWCHECGVPKHPQTGSIVLQRRGLTIVGGWVPYWRFDVYCLEQSLADEARKRFAAELRPVAFPREGGAEASQIVINSSSVPWFDPADLFLATTSIHGEACEKCPVCGVTRWMPVGMEVLPAPPAAALEGQPLVVASPEWFGAGKRSFRAILWRRDFAEFLVGCAPKDFQIQEKINWQTSTSA